MFLKSDIHAIKIASMHHGLDDSLIQPRVFLKPEEEFKAQSLLDKYGLEHKKYICFEPNSNLEWTPNRRWIDHYWGEFLESMQDWFDRNNLEYKIVQIGDKNPRLRFYDTINLCGESSFRETAYILQKSSVFISTEGGLGHLATAAYARTLMIMSGYNPEALIKYPQNTNIYECVECFGCGLRTECPNDLKCMQLITPDKVLESIKNILTESKES
jgi:ADP-heptose:LPS heptosyltransferase